MRRTTMLKSAVPVTVTSTHACSAWSAVHVARIDHNVLPCISVLDEAAARSVVAGLTLWDIWPLQLADGTLADVAGGSLWVVLSAPRRDDPDLRHEEARMRLLYRRGDQWHDCGDLLPDGFAPGSREWSGSARLDPEAAVVTLWFTAAGRRDVQRAHDFEQRLFHATGTLDLSGPLPRIAAWRDLAETVVNDGHYYADLAIDQGVPGHIKGFRDPYWFRDPADGSEYLLFTGSKAAIASRSSHDGVIGIARRERAGSADRYCLLPPLIDADGLANELERPHLFVHDGLYYLFWSSQAHIFAPGGPAGPTGLYGMVAPAMFGPYEPLNGTGLVLANPVSEPRQCYAWQVVPSNGSTLSVASFIDYCGLGRRDPADNPALKSRQFGGTIAPFVTIALDGATSRIVEGGA
jgi:levansucrase